MTNNIMINSLHRSVYGAMKLYILLVVLGIQRWKHFPYEIYLIQHHILNSRRSSCMENLWARKFRI